LRAAIGAGLALAWAAVALPPVAHAADAKALFIDGKCQRCHSVESQGIAAKPKAGKEDEVHDLSKVGAERPVDWIQKFLRKQEAIKGKKHKQKYRGSDEDLKTLAT
jgi:mono/diheme cytochrome c family protein